MTYIKMTIEEANRSCKKNATVLVATTDLTDDNTCVEFIKRKGMECDELFVDAQTIFKSLDDFVKKLDIYTAKQDIENIVPIGIRRTILLRE